MRLALALLVFAACGDGIGGPDATPPTDGALGLVTVRAEPGDAARGVQVFFQNSDSSLVLSTRMSFEGIANAYMAPGGFVTIVVTNGNTHFLYT